MYIHSRYTEAVTCNTSWFTWLYLA